MISLAVAAAALVVALFAGEMLPSTRPPGSSRKLAVPWADAPGGSAACEAFVQTPTGEPKASALRKAGRGT